MIHNYLSRKFLLTAVFTFFGIVAAFAGKLTADYVALATLVIGLAIAGAPPQLYLVQALTFQEGFRNIGLGMWLGIIMAANVWMFIWPNQKIALGIVDADADAKAKAAKTAMLFSRTNFVLSFPMLYCMVTRGVLG